MRKRKKKEPDTELLETAEAGRVLDVTPAYVRLLQRRGKLPAAVVTRRGQRLYRREDVEALARLRRERSRGAEMPQGGVGRTPAVRADQ